MTLSFLGNKKSQAIKVMIENQVLPSFNFIIAVVNIQPRYTLSNVHCESLLSSVPKFRYALPFPPSPLRGILKSVIFFLKNFHKDRLSCTIDLCDWQ